MKFSDVFKTAAPAASSGIVGVVTNSTEFARIFNLPRRVLDISTIPDVTPLFARSGERSFWPIQSAALIEAAQADGLFAPIGVGYGKTLICLALADALDAERAVILVKPDLRRQLDREVATFYDRHFKLPLDRITVVTYRELSDAATADILERIGPDLVVADEAHALRYPRSARTKRFLRYMSDAPHCRFAALSGTMTNRTICDYAHLIELALRKNSPLPRGYREVKDWAGALDVEPDYVMRPGVLKHFCRDGEDVRQGYQRRLVETEGVVATESGAIGSSLVLRRLHVARPTKVLAAIEGVERHWTIGGEEIASATDKARILQQLNTGFYYRWNWPGDPDTEWLDARAEWHREVRDKLRNSRPGMDSPLLLARAADRYWKWVAKGQPEPAPDKPMWASRTWLPWKRVKNRKAPPVEAVWLDDYVPKQALAWGEAQNAPAIIWYRWRAVGQWLAQHVPHYGAGTDASIATEPLIACSIRTQGTGKNLQHYCRNLFITVPPNGTTFEQTVGRTHRPGQLADRVTGDWLSFNDEAMKRVIEDAEYMQATTGQRQKVLYADHVK